MAKHRSDRNGKARSRQAAPRGAGSRSLRKSLDRRERRIARFHETALKEGGGLYSTGHHLMHQPGSLKKVH